MITIYDWFGYELPIQERYRFIRQAGFDGVLLWWSESFGRNDYRGGPQLVRDAGLFIENIHAPLQNQNDLWLDNLNGKALIDCYLQCAADCAQFEIPTMVIHLPDEDHPYNATGLDRIKRLAEKAEQLSINVALENLCNLTNVAYMLEQVDSKRIGFCYDCGHHYHYNPDDDLLSRYRSRLMAMHLHDILLQDDGNYAIHRFPFDGTIHWSEVMKNLAKTGYSGATAVELMNWDYTHFSAEQFLQTAFERAKKLDNIRLSNL